MCLVYAFFTWRNFPIFQFFVCDISLEEKKKNQMIGTCNSLVAQPLRDHLAGISLCWNKRDYIFLFLCVGIMGLHSPISVAFQEPFMNSMIKCK